MRSNVVLSTCANLKWIGRVHLFKSIIIICDDDDNNIQKFPESYPGLFFWPGGFTEDDAYKKDETSNNKTFCFFWLSRSNLNLVQ